MSNEITVKTLVEKCNLKVINMADENTLVAMPYCCDLLSIAMGNAPAGSAWCTVMANRNTLAVSALAETACTILCCDTTANKEMIDSAIAQNINLFATSESIFETALSIHNLLS